MPYLLLFAFINYANFALEMTTKNENEKPLNESNQDTYKIRDSINNLPSCDKQTLKDDNETNLCLMPDKLIEQNESAKINGIHVEELNKIYNHGDESDYKFFCSSFSNKWLSLIGVS
jgi:hypothetical protein